MSSRICSLKHPPRGSCSSPSHAGVQRDPTNVPIPSDLPPLLKLYAVCIRLITRLVLGQPARGEMARARSARVAKM